MLSMFLALLIALPSRRRIHFLAVPLCVRGAVRIPLRASGEFTTDWGAALPKIGLSLSLALFSLRRRSDTFHALSAGGGGIAFSGERRVRSRCARARYPGGAPSGRKDEIREFPRESETSV